MVALTGDEAGALSDRLAQSVPGYAAGETLVVSANASTSITFTDTEKAAVLDVLVRWLDSEDVAKGDGLLRLKNAFAHDLKQI